jgi:hypothetical protein
MGAQFSAGLGLAWRVFTVPPLYAPIGGMWAELKKAYL